MQFEPAQYSELMGSLLIDEAVKYIPLFGSEKEPVATIISQVLSAHPPDTDTVVDFEANDDLPESYSNATTTAAKILALRKHAPQISQSQELSNNDRKSATFGVTPDKTSPDAPGSVTGLVSNRQAHESILTTTLNTKGFPKTAQVVLDHIMLLRSQEKYLFDYQANINITSDDPWLKDLWLWVASMYHDSCAADRD